MTFSEALSEQRWDDHRYYHHNRVNQALHLVSALSFILAYGLLWVEPAAAVLLAWLVAMPSRQIGHFFFEPRDYDLVNDASHDRKEAIKVGYNLRRKAILLWIWALSPLVLDVESDAVGPAGVSGELGRGRAQRLRCCGSRSASARLPCGPFTFSSFRDVQTGLVWAAKIVTDPFHDVKLYHRAPFQILRGELVEPRVTGHAD